MGKGNTRANSGLNYPYGLVLSLGLLGFTTGCLKGPSFMQTQSESSKNTRTPADTLVDSSKSSGTISRTIVSTIIEGSKSKGTVNASSQNAQVVQASSNSKIAGAQVEFPPGSIAIDTEITIQPGLQVATEQTLQSLSIDSQVASRASPMVVTSSVAIDTESPFSVTLPLPNSGLTLTKDFPQFGLADPMSNLVIFYNVQIAAENRFISGVIPRRDIEVINGYARIFTRHFGTFQSAIMTKPIDAPVQVAAASIPPPQTPISTDPAFTPRRYYVNGPASSSAGKATAFRNWIPTVTPMMVGTTTTLTVGVRSYPSLD